MKLELADATAQALEYSHGVLTFVGTDGFPVAVAVTLLESSPERLTLSSLPPSMRPAKGSDVELIFSHIRPQPGIGYDERRYVNVWGTASVKGATVSVTPARASGWDEAQTPFFQYAEQNVKAGRTYLDELGRTPHLSRWWTIFLALRLPFLTATIVPISLGGAVAAYDHRFALVPWLLCLLAGVCAHLGINVLNDLADDTSGADAANSTPTPFSGGSRMLQYGLVSRQTLTMAVAALYTLASATGLYLALTRSLPLLFIGALALVLGYGYTAPPFRFVHRGLGEPVVALGFGPIMVVGTYLALTDRFSLPALLASIPVGLLTAGILYVNQLPDRLGDAATGKRTLIVRWPRAWVLRGYVGLTLTSAAFLVGAVVFGLAPWPTLLALLGLDGARKCYRLLGPAYDAPYALIPAMRLNILAHLVTGTLLTFGFLLALLLRQF